MKKPNSLLAVTLLTAVVTIAGIWVLVNSVEPLRWRSAVMFRYVTGGIEDVRFAELMNMLRPGTDYYISRILEGKALSVAVNSPFGTKTGIEAGARIFQERCSFCHGADAGGGGKGGVPSLKSRSSYRHGSLDWAIYRAIADGIPGTNMPSVGLSFDESWKVVSFLNSISTDGDFTGAANSDQQALPVTLMKFKGLPYRQLLEAGHDADEWRTYSRTYSGWRYSPLKQINTDNVGELRLRWMRQLKTASTKIEASPIVVGGVMFITEPPNNVLALEAGTGKVLWTYHHQFREKPAICCGQVNRGVAVLDDMVYVGTLDARLVALEAKTGKIIWDIKLGEPKEGYSSTGAPLAVKDMIITGMAGSEFPTRGFLQAVDAKTGKTRWRFDTIPGPGEPGHGTWGGDSWKTGGGSTWVTGSFDPELNLVYWGVSNPNPDFNGDSRPGDNLYTCSVIAVDATTGKLKWHFQFTPHDEHDWGANQTPVLASVMLNGVGTPVIATANRNGFYYVLDRRDGRFITGVPFMDQNWAEGLDRSGRPILSAASKVTYGGVLTKPDVGGGTNWWPPAFNPDLGLFYVHADESTGIYSKSKSSNAKPGPYALSLGGGTQSVGNRDAFVRALKIATGEKLWEYRSISDGRGMRSGLLTTAGRLVFGAANEKAFALDAATGKELWGVDTGGEVWQGPVSYSIAGEQMVVFISGRTVIAFSL